MKMMNTGSWACFLEFSMILVSAVLLSGCSAPTAGLQRCWKENDGRSNHCDVKNFVPTKDSSIFPLVRLGKLVLKPGRVHYPCGFQKQKQDCFSCATHDADIDSGERKATPKKRKLSFRGKPFLCLKIREVQRLRKQNCRLLFFWAA